MLEKFEKERILHLRDRGLSFGEIAEDILNWRFPELYRDTRMDVERYIKEKDQ